MHGTWFSSGHGHHPLLAWHRCWLASTCCRAERIPLPCLCMYAHARPLRCKPRPPTTACWPRPLPLLALALLLAHPKRAPKRRPRLHCHHEGTSRAGSWRCCLLPLAGAWVTSSWLTCYVRDADHALPYSGWRRTGSRATRCQSPRLALLPLTHHGYSCMG